jgi:4-hydroxy-tetrahydrodipicolinate reductase
MRVGVCGAGGRMGATVCHAVAADPALELVAAVDPHAAGSTIEGVTIAAEPKAFADSGAEVVVDFTVAAAARKTVPWLAMHGIHAVVGTTGLTDDDLETFRTEFCGGGPNCVVAANFSISAVLMMRFAEIAAPFFDTAEVIELHHDGKADAPSGTAMATVERMAAASSEWAPDPTTHEVLPGARGGAGPGGIHVHSVRMRGMVAHQEVILGALGQTLTLRQDSYDRESFMPGVLLACKRVADHPGVTIGLDAILGL